MNGHIFISEWADMPKTAPKQYRLEIEVLTHFYAHDQVFARAVLLLRQVNQPLIAIPRRIT